MKQVSALPTSGNPLGCLWTFVLQCWFACAGFFLLLVKTLKVKVKSLSCVRLLATSWTAAYQAPPSMGFSRQEYWSGVPLPSPTHIKRGALIFGSSNYMRESE